MTSIKIWIECPVTVVGQQSCTKDLERTPACLCLTPENPEPGVRSKNYNLKQKIE